MKDRLGGMLLLLLAVAAVPLSVAVHERMWLIACAPAVFWSLFVLLGQKRWKPLRDSKAVVLGILYGGLAAPGTASLLQLLVFGVFPELFRQHPYDSAAFFIIFLLSVFLFLMLAFVDGSRLGMKPFWLRLVTALVAFLPCVLLALKAMAYFEGVLSHYVA